MDVFTPETLEDALKTLSNHGEGGTILANGTDLVPRMVGKEVSPTKLIDISGLRRELVYITEENDAEAGKGKVLRVGALTTVRDIQASPLFRGRLEAFRQAARVFGGPQIRNMATIGGNIGAASSSEDFVPVLMALDAKVRLASLAGERIVSADSIISDKRKVEARHDEMIVEVIFRLPPENAWTQFEKIGRRNSLIINLVNMAVYLELLDGRQIGTVRIALNRLLTRVPQRALKAERFLTSKELNKDVLAEAASLLGAEAKLTSDFRASGGYRSKLDQVILRRLVANCASKITGQDLSILS